MHELIVIAAEIAFRPLDLDHARARVREPAGAHRRRDGLFERDDEEAGQWESHVFLSSSAKADDPVFGDDGVWHSKYITCILVITGCPPSRA